MQKLADSMKKTVCELHFFKQKDKSSQLNLLPFDKLRYVNCILLGN